MGPRPRPNRQGRLEGTFFRVGWLFWAANAGGATGRKRAFLGSPELITLVTSEPSLAVASSPRYIPKPCGAVLSAPSTGAEKRAAKKGLQRAPVGLNFAAAESRNLRQRPRPTGQPVARPISSVCWARAPLAAGQKAPLQYRELHAK